MKRSLKHSAAGFAAIVLATSSVHAQTLVYSFETLYDNNDMIDPAGTRPDDFHTNSSVPSDTTITQSTIGVTNGSYSMEFAQLASATFTGAQTEVVPEIINDPNTQALSFDLTVPATGAFGGTFARIGVSEFGNNASQGYMGIQVQCIANSEVNIDLGAGTYHFTIPLIAISNPVTGDATVPFSQCMGNDPDTQLVPASFEFFINKSTQTGLNVYIDNVQAIGPATNGTWAFAGGGNWATTGDWTGGVPQLALDTANFTSAITANSTIALSANWSVGTLNFNNAHSYIISPGTGGTLTLDAGGSNTANINDSGGTHTISAPVDFNTNTAITVTNSTDALNISGNVSGVGSLTVTGSGTVDLSGTNSYIGGTTVSSGVLVLGSATALPTTNAVVNIGSTATLKLATGIGGVSMQLPNITAGGKFDINNDHAFINYTPGADPIASVVAMIKSGYANGAWTGPGIMSTAAQTNSQSYGIGYADAADPGNPAQLGTGQIEIMYTLLGDANLDGKVNGTDFNILAANFNTGGDSWDQGDFTYDGKVNGSDFNLLAANFNQGATQSADLAALDSFASANGVSLANVPEPASAAIMVIAGLGILRRQRRRNW